MKSHPHVVIFLLLTSLFSSNLAWAKYEDNSYDYKLPDEVGNLYKTKERTDRKYGPGSKLLQGYLQMNLK